MRRSLFLALALLPVTALPSCGVLRGDHSDSVNEADRPEQTAWPASLLIVGDGFPNPGDPCRRVGETAATVNYLDDSASLVGCPRGELAAALGGRTVTTVDGITLVSVPNAREAVAGDGDGQPDARVAGTKFNATADVPCTGVGGSAASCAAGVTRSPDQIAVEITVPTGGKRTLLFDGRGKFVTHASAQADGSAALASSATRNGDWTVVSVGSEQYRLPDAFVLGD